MCLEVYVSPQLPEPPHPRIVDVQPFETVRKPAKALFNVSMAISLLGGVATFAYSHIHFPWATSVVHVVPISTPASYQFTVSSTQPWQGTKIIVKNGDKLTISYVVGTWSSEPGVFSRAEADGVTLPDGSQIPINTLCFCGEPVPGFSTQGLVGKIGNGKPFAIGNLYNKPEASSGKLLLQINDGVNGLSDNVGSVMITITDLPTPHH
jgi:hypothetical protein